MTDRTLKIACVLATGAPGGAELALATLLAHRPPEIEPRVLLMSDGPIADLLHANGIPASVVPLPSAEPARVVRFELKLLRALRATAPDFVFAVGNKAALLSLPAARMAGVPCVWYKVDLVMPRWQAAAVAVLSRQVIAMSRAAGAGIRSARLTVINPPVRLPEGFLVPEHLPPATLTCLARLEPTKGQHYLIKAAKILRARFPAVRVLLAGEACRNASYSDSLRELACRSEVPIEITGHIDVVERVLERTTVYVQPSFQDSQGLGGEGFGIALAEASWAGLPVVASNTGGTPEVVADGVTGLLVPPRDPGALAEAVARYLSDPEAARSAGHAGARVARERFHPDRVGARLFETIAGLT